ncbi:MAG: CHC2 zinc finger domain-containing protein [Candidatus Moraniibacteriota bacterium]
MNAIPTVFARSTVNSPPSFTVSEEGGLFHCYGCGAFGDVVHFLLFYFRSHHRVSDFERDERRKINEEFELWHSTYTGNQSLDAYERSEYQLLWEIYRKKLEQLEHQVERELQKLKSEQAFNYLDAIRWLANRYRYWPSQHRRLEKRSKKI